MIHKAYDHFRVIAFLKYDLQEKLQFSLDMIAYNKCFFMACLQWSLICFIMLSQNNMFKE